MLTCVITAISFDNPLCDGLFKVNLSVDAMELDGADQKFETLKSLKLANAVQNNL